MIDFQWGLVPFSLTPTHENVRGLGTKYISWAIKNDVKRLQKYSENIPGPLKIPRQGDNHDPWIFHPIKWPWICTPWKFWIYFMAFSWTPWKSHNKSNSWVIKKVMAFSRVFHCISYNLDSLFHGPLIVNFSKHFHGFFNGIFIGWTHENTLSFGHENLVNKAWKSCEFPLNKFTRFLWVFV